MAYTAWSVVFGEQPTAAKWNQLGTNDAGFKDGTNIDNDVIGSRQIQLANDAKLNALNASAVEKALISLATDNYLRLNQIPRRNGTTNDTLENVLIQTGWGYGVGDNTNATTFSNVSFPISYGSSNPPILLISTLGYLSGSNPTAISDFNSGAGFYFVASPLSTGAGFSPSVLARDAGQTNSTTVRYGYSWIAIGAKA